MLKNKNINIILAFIIAVSLWAYVLGDVNPKTEVVIKEVPIVFENEATLSDDGLVILNYSYASVNVTITGPRTEVTKVSKGDFLYLLKCPSKPKSARVISTRHFCPPVRAV